MEQSEEAKAFDGERNLPILLDIMTYKDDRIIDISDQ